MIGIKAISSYVPVNRIDNFKRAEEVFDESREFIKNKIGAHYLPRKLDEEETSDMAVKAIQALVEEHGLQLANVDVLVIVTQNPDGYGLPHTSAIVHRKMGLSNSVAAFDVSLGCSGYVYGLSIIKGLMEQAGFSNGILVTADPYSKILSSKDRSTSLLFGDAATATWLSIDGLWKLGTPILQTEGQGAGNLCVEDGLLHMNGRQVFNFASKYVWRQIKECLLKNKLEEADVDFFCLHQGSAYIVSTVSKKFPNAKDRFLNDIEATGNTVSSSIPLLLEKYIMESDARTVLLSGFGVGLSWASNIIFKES